MLRTAKLLVLVSISMDIFSAKANAVCDYSYSDGQSRTISSPNFPLQYTNSLNCTYQISVPVGYSAYFRFTAFATEECCDRLTFSCVSGTPYGPRNLSGADYPATLLISSCALVKLAFISDGSVADTGFSFSYSFVPGNTILDGFQIKPSNIFLQANQENMKFTVNCSSISGLMVWWSYTGYYVNNNYWTSGVNDTVTNGFCKVSTNYNQSFVSESLGHGTCNLIAVGLSRSMSYNLGTFVCNYGTSTSAAAILATPNPGFLFSRILGGPSYPTLDSLSPTRGDEIQFMCSPQSTNLSLPSSSIIQIKILRSYWINQTKGDASDVIAYYNASCIVVRVDPLLGVLPSHTCGVDVQFISGIPSLDSTAPTFKTEAIQVNVEVDSETMSITGGTLGKITRGGVLSCYSPAYPLPTYSWTDVVSGQQVIGPKIDVTHSGQYTCTASNVFNEELYRGSKSIMLEITEDGGNASNQGLNAPTIILVAVVGAVILIICITAIIVVFCLLKKRLAAGLAGNSFIGSKTGPAGSSIISSDEHELVSRRQLPRVPDRPIDNGGRYIDTPITHGDQPSSNLTPGNEQAYYEQLHGRRGE